MEVRKVSKADSFVTLVTEQLKGMQSPTLEIFKDQKDALAVDYDYQNHNGLITEMLQIDFSDGSNVCVDLSDDGIVDFSSDNGSINVPSFRIK